MCRRVLIFARCENYDSGLTDPLRPRAVKVVQLHALLFTSSMGLFPTLRDHLVLPMSEFAFQLQRLFLQVACDSAVATVS